jgi:Rrf2 family protein
VRLSARGDYAVRAVVELAAADGRLLTSDKIAEAQQIPAHFLTNILVALRRAQVVSSQRGTEGGYRLARPAPEISLADVIRAVEGPLAGVRGERPESLDYHGPAEPLRDVWIALRASIREVLEETSVDDVATGQLPESVRRRASVPDAWLTR